MKNVRFVFVSLCFILINVCFLSISHRAIGQDCGTPLSTLKAIETSSGSKYQFASVTIDATDYEQAFQIPPVSSPVYFEYYLGKKFSRFTSLVGASDFAYSRFEATYVVIGDGVELGRLGPFSPSMPPKKFDINVFSTGPKRKG